jgi:phage terminase small subunit
MSKLKTHFFDNEARRCFKIITDEMENEATSIDKELLVTFCNLRSQKIQLEKEVQENGYTAVNVNSRGGKTYQVHPSYRAYLSCVAELTKIRNRLVKVTPEKLDDPDDDFDDF